MNSKLIYLDTNAWNRLLDQRVNPQSLLADLGKKDANLALSGQTVYELAKTFLGSASTASIRARELFRYLKQYVDAEIPCAHDNMEQLHGEVQALNTGASQVVAFYGPKEYALLKDEVEKLAEASLMSGQSNSFLVANSFLSPPAPVKKTTFRVSSMSEINLRMYLKMSSKRGCIGKCLPIAGRQYWQAIC